MRGFLDMKCDPRRDKREFIGLSAEAERPKNIKKAATNLKSWNIIKNK